MNNDFLKNLYIAHPTTTFSTSYYKYLILSKNMKEDVLIKDASYSISVYDNNFLLLNISYKTKINLPKKILYTKMILDESNYNKTIISKNIIFDYIDEKYTKGVTYYNSPPLIDYSCYKFSSFSKDSINDIRDATNIINNSYDDIKISSTDITNWFDNDVYNNGIGYFILNDDLEKIGFIFITIDNTISEASVEWLQILPDYQNMRFGKTLLSYALMIASTKSKFCTVCFKNTNYLKHFYASCGFSYFNTWHILTKTDIKYIDSDNTLKRKIEEIKFTCKKPKLLIHSCCGPCSSYVLNYLSNYFLIDIYYYNPNIYPESEFNHRLTEQIKIQKLLSKNTNIISPNYNHTNYLNTVGDKLTQKEGSLKCYLCYKERLVQTAIYAKDNNYDYFTTTLSISPYKNSDWINKIGFELEKEYNINFLYSNFKLHDGYKKSIELSKKYDLYRQEYCGCETSLKDSLNKNK